MQFDEITEPLSCEAEDELWCQLASEFQALPVEAFLFTDALVAALQAREREYVVRDTVNPALAVRVRPSGTKSFYVYALPEERTHWSRRLLGRSSTMTVVEARRLVVAHRSAEHIGETSAASIEAYLGTVPPNAARKRQLLTAHFIPIFGTSPLEALHRGALVALTKRVACQHRTQANDLMKAMKTLFSWAAHTGRIQGNPLTGASPPSISQKEPVRLSVEQLAKVLSTAQTLPDPWRTLFTLLLQTGERVEDIRHMRIESIDWTNETWELPRRPTGEPVLRPMSLGTLELLDKYRENTGFLFPSSRGDGHRPIILRADIIEELRNKSGIYGWSLPDIRQCVWRHLPSTYHRGLAVPRQRDALNKWVGLLEVTYMDIAKSKFLPDDDVVL